jgi:hypothetical protein
MPSQRSDGTVSVVSRLRPICALVVSVLLLGPARSARAGVETVTVRLEEARCFS